MAEQKHREKTSLRSLYDRMLRSNHERRTNELKAELVFDMKLTEKNLQEKSDEEYERFINKASDHRPTIPTMHHSRMRHVTCP